MNANTSAAIDRPFTFTGRLRSFKYAAHGIAMMLRCQHNAWIHLAATLAVIACAFALGVSRFDWCALVFAIVGVWVAEALNTAFEFLCDVASPDFHPLVKNAKDVAAGAVLVAAIGAVIVGVMIFAPHVVA